MRNDDIEILDDFSENQVSTNQEINQVSNQNQNLESNTMFEQNQSVSDFEKMVNEASDIQNDNLNNQIPSNDYQGQNEFVNYDNNTYYNDTNQYYGDNNLNNNLYNYDQNIQPDPNNQFYGDQAYKNDFATNDYNNDLVQSNNNQDLTITAVYPNGFAVDQQEELENTQVIKTKKKSSGDLYLIIIVAVLAITLVVLLIVFYL